MARSTRRTRGRNSDADGDGAIAPRSGVEPPLGGAPLDLALGPRIRDLRQKANHTLASLSAKTGVAIGTLSQLERGLVSPNVRTLFTISNALGMSAASLLDPTDINGRGNESTYIVRAGARRRFIDSGGVRKDVASPPSSTRLRGYYMVIEPGCGSGQQPYSHSGEEIGLIISGTLELRIDGELFSVGEGDCFAFNSSKPHLFANVGTRPATVFWVNASL